MSKKGSQTSPLPATTPQEELETISRNKLMAILDPQCFEVRPVTIRDKGNDFLIELKHNDTYTNFQFAIQLKSTNSTAPNKDGSFSYPVAVSNINYLSNFAMPAYYMLYEHNSNKFYVEEVNHIFHRLARTHNLKNPPKTFTIKFSKALTPEYIHKIYQHTLAKGTLLKKLNAHLIDSLAEPDTITGISIDADNDVYSVEQNMSFIERFGLLLLNKNDYTRIIEIEQRTHPRTNASPIFNMVCGLAYYYQSNLYKALELLKPAEQHADTFAPELRSMLIYTILNAKYLLGILPESELNAETARIMDTEKIGSFLQLENAFRRLRNSTGDTRKNIKTFYKTTTRIISREPDNKSLLLMAYANVLDAEAVILTNDITNNLILLCGKVSAPFKTQTYLDWTLQEALYSTRLLQLMQFALKEKNMLATVNLEMARIAWEYKRIFIDHIFNHWDNATCTVTAPVDEKDRQFLMKNIGFIDHTMKSFDLLGHRENMITSLMLKFEILQFINEAQQATDTAQKIRELIAQYDFNGLKKGLHHLLSGANRYQRFVDTLSQRITQLREIVKGSDLEKHLLKAIPDEVLPYMEKDIQWTIDRLLPFKLPT